MMSSHTCLMLMSEVPCATGTGAEVRSFHFSRTVASLVPTVAAILSFTPPGSTRKPPEIPFKAVHQPLSTVSKGGGPGGLLQGCGRVLATLLLPSLRHGSRLMEAGRLNCLTRHEGDGTPQPSILHRIYGNLLYAESRICRALFLLWPSAPLIRLDAWEAVRPDVLESLGKEGPRFIWCEHSYLFPLAESLKKRFPDAHLIVNAHNVEWKLNQRIAGSLKSRSARRWTLLEADILRQWEGRMLEKADLLICCSEYDAGEFRKTAGSSCRARIEVIPNGVDTTHFEPIAPTPNPPVLLFTGTAGYPPNDDAVAHLVSDIFPRVLREIPECRLVLAGRNADSHWSIYGEASASIQIAANVADMRPFFHGATLCVVPLRTGSGTRLKILEAMSMGKAVISTSVGAEGIDVQDGKHLILADTPALFAEAITSLIRYDLRRHEIELAGRCLVCDRYDWKPLQEMTKTLFLEVAASHGGSSGQI
jgi:glycosyltransferase involved in cell wall biosynthesis